METQLAIQAIVTLTQTYNTLMACGQNKDAEAVQAKIMELVKKTVAKMENESEWPQLPIQTIKRDPVALNLSKRLQDQRDYIEDIADSNRTDKRKATLVSSAKGVMVRLYIELGRYATEKFGI